MEQQQQLYLSLYLSLIYPLMYVCILVPSSSAILREYLPDVLEVRSKRTAIPAKKTKGLCSPSMHSSELGIIRELLRD